MGLNNLLKLITKLDDVLLSEINIYLINMEKQLFQ